MEFKYTVPITEYEIIEEKEGKPTKVRVGGTCLATTISRNKNKFVINNITENDNKEVKFFIQEHGDLQLNNIVGKVKLSKVDNDLRYDGVLRNTTKHPDVVEHAMNKEIDVSIDARAYGRNVVKEGEGYVKTWDKVDVRALCGVGIGGLAQNSMDFAIAESFKGVEDELKVHEKEQKKLEAIKMEEVEKLKAELIEQEKLVKEQEEVVKKQGEKLKKIDDEKKEGEKKEKEKVVESIQKLNKEIDLKDKSISELRLIHEYEKKIHENDDDDEGAGEGKDEGDDKGSSEEEGDVIEKEDIVIEEKKDRITLSDKGYKKFQEDLRKSIYT